MLDTVVRKSDFGGVILYGREFSPELIKRLNEVDPTQSRRALSRQLCEWLDWKGPSGRWQLFNARLALQRLGELGAIRLSPAGVFKTGRRQRGRLKQGPWPEIQGSLKQIGPVQVVLIGSRHSSSSRQCHQLLEAYHPLGSRLCGAQLRYLICCPKGILGVLCFSAAARRLGPRDQWIGWADAVRRENLHLVVNNSRFLIRPGVQVAHLASHVLALAARQLPEDWQSRYSYRPCLLESFVEAKKYEGTSYRASNWIELKEMTAGRGRNDLNHRGRKTRKRIFLYPLQRNFRQRLQQAPAQCRLVQPPTVCAPSKPPLDWAEEEWAQADLGDQRLNRRLMILGRDFYGHSQGNVALCCDGDRAKTRAAYRFFDHEKVTMQSVLQSHYQATAQRMAKEAVVLVPQDTTYLNYSTHPATENLGPIGTRPDGLIGLVVHDTMAFNLEGTPLGLLDVQCWARDPEQFGKKHRRRALDFEQKESVKWLRSLEALERAQRHCPDTQIVTVGDREADIYELFVWSRQPQRPALLVRASNNRRVQSEHGYLWEQMAATPVARIVEVKVPRRANRDERMATLEVRFNAIQLKAPKTRARLPSVALWAIWVREIHAPAKAEPLEWMLLTTLAIPDVEQACQKIEWYSRRWGIEVYHRTLKSGCQLKNRQLRSADRIEACLAIDMVVAWRIFHLAKLARETPDVACTVYFEDMQWKALTGFITKNPFPPAQPPTLREATRMLAKLGGFLGRKSDGEPGTQTIWLGLQRLDDIVDAWKVFSETFLRPTVSSNRTYG